jgi:hypothetical protein
MKKTKITLIPHYPTRYYDNQEKKWVYSDTLSPAYYDGEVQFDHEKRDEDGRWIKLSPVMIPNTPFDDTLTYVDFYRGRSAAGCTFRNDVGQRFTVFMTDMDKFIPLMVNGKISGRFIFCKRGKNYGITLYTG